MKPFTLPGKSESSHGRFFPHPVSWDLSVYAAVIFLSPDPEWVVWAGQMSVGVIDPSALPPSPSAGTGEAFRTASALSVLGLPAAAVLLAAAIGMRPGWFSRLHGHDEAHGDPQTSTARRSSFRLARR